jgi:hypothetical protein
MTEATMFKPHYLQDRLNSMILTPKEAEAFKVQREQYAKTNMLLVTQEKLEAAREASVAMLKSLFAAQEYEMPKIDERVLVNYFGFAAKRSAF